MNLFRRLSALIVASAFLTLVGHYGGPGLGWLVYLFKPLTTGLIVLLALLAPAGASPRYRWGIVAGLGFSLAGDVFLMLPRDLFVQGLACFLVAHLCYLVAFTDRCRLFPRWEPVVALAALAGGALALLWPGLAPGLRLPVVVYALALCSMAAQAIGRGLLLATPSARAAAWGAALFVLSDALLASDRFRHPFPAATAAILVTYFAAQWGIARSVRVG